MTITNAVQWNQNNHMQAVLILFITIQYLVQSAIKYRQRIRFWKYSKEKYFNYIHSGKIFNIIRYSNSCYNRTFPVTKLNLILFNEKIA